MSFWKYIDILYPFKLSISYIKPMTDTAVKIEDRIEIK